ncbi:MAG: hypothetical protein ACRDSO_01705, partial [Pseudonocardiaceae bacterium]
QRGEHCETHLLGYVIRRYESLVLDAEPGAAVPQHERTNPAEHSVNGISLTVDGSTNKDGEVVRDFTLGFALIRRKRGDVFGELGLDRLRESSG